MITKVCGWYSCSPDVRIKHWKKWRAKYVRLKTIKMELNKLKKKLIKKQTVLIKNCFSDFSV